MEKVTTFYQEVKEELKKVSWPTKDATVGTTIVVLVMVLVLSAYLGVLDSGLSKLAQFVVG